MQVLQIANDYLGSRIYKHLFSVLKERDVDQTVFVPVQYGAQISEQPEKVHVVPCFHNADRVLFYTKQRRMLRWVEENLDLKNFDVTHAHTVFSGGYLAWQLYKRHGIPYIVAVRDTDVNVFFKYMVHLRHVGAQILADAHQVIFLSSEYKENVLNNCIPAKYRQNVLCKSHVIPNGIAKLFFEHRGEPKQGCGDPIQLIYVGQINSRKNLELTVQAAEKLRANGQDVTLTAVGKIGEEKYRQLMESKDFVTHYDGCAQEEVLAHMRAADIFVMPSHRETFGLVYAEAMSQGLPVLYTRNQGFDGQFPDGTVGYAISDTDAQDVAEKICLVKEHYETLSANAVTLVDKFRWDTIAEEYIGIYHAAKGERR